MVLDHVKHALKRVMKFYTQEKNTPSGLSPYETEKKAKKEYGGVWPHAATIWQYVNANLASMSPLKMWVKGDISTCAFKSLCTAFKNFICIQQINSCQGGWLRIRNNW